MRTHQVLVIDDDRDIRDSLIDFLRDHDYDPVGAVHGRDALDKLGGPDLGPCAIILDLMMPVMDGWMFREEQLRIPALAKIPVIVISAHKDVADMFKVFKDLDVAARLPKPLDLAALLDLLREHCPAG